MPLRVLGLSAFYHDSAAALVVDGELVAAAQEERFSRRKHDGDFPREAAAYCLAEAGIAPAELDLVVFYEKPLLKFDRLLETYVAYAPAGLRSFLAAMPLWLKSKLHLDREIRRGVGDGYQKKIVYTGHHEAHAACAFLCSPFEKSAILTIDGVGEWQTASIGVGEGNRVKLLKSLEFPHSLGLLYSAVTYFCGFKVNSGEYKLMGLAPYGTPQYAELMLEKLVDLKSDGSLRMAMDYFTYPQSLRMTGRRFEQLFGGAPRQPEEEITEREMDLAASIQAVTEEVLRRMARHAREVTGQPNLCLAGGVALNCVANGVLLREKIFEDLWIPPAAGDAGGAVGAAMLTYHQLMERPRVVKPRDVFAGSLLGPRYGNAEIGEFLRKRGAPHRYHEREEELLEAVVRAMTAGKVVGWFQGRMEFGPRALGCRSIIGDARNVEMQAQMNLRIKYRESFRPFAPSVLEEDVAEYFELDRPSPYMLLVAPVRKELQCDLTEAERQEMRAPDLRKRVKVKRSQLPAITHVDMSARIQTVNEPAHGRYYRLIREFKRQTGVGVIINTSFNIRGEPIVCKPEEAYRCFRGSEMDVLVMENHVLYKEEQATLSEEEKRNYQTRFEAD